MSPEAPNFLVYKGDCLHVFLTPQMREPFLTAFWIDGKDILYHNMNFPDRAAARAVCLGLHAVRGDYGGCESARAARLGSHAARGGRGGRSSASTMRMVVMARLARCARSGRCSWRLATIII